MADYLKQDAPPQLMQLWARVIIGLIGLFLALFLTSLSGTKEGESIASMSASYWTDSGDMFVGCLFVVGFYLMILSPTERPEEKKEKEKEWIIKWLIDLFLVPWVERGILLVCAVMAVVVALFPTLSLKGLKPAQWVMTVAESVPFVSWVTFCNSSPSDAVSCVHAMAAVFLFVGLILLAMIYALVAWKKWQILLFLTYGAAAILMAIFLAAAAAYRINEDSEFAECVLSFLRSIGEWEENTHPTFLLEQALLLAFGAGWTLAATGIVGGSVLLKYNPEFRLGVRVGRTPPDA